jgi:hypothetical protein
MNLEQFSKQIASGLANGLGWRMASLAPTWALKIGAVLVAVYVIYETIK